VSSLLLVFGTRADTLSSYRDDPGRGPSWTMGIAIWITTRRRSREKQGQGLH
jgi:hypothetical protein